MVFLSLMSRVTDAHIHSYQPRVMTSINRGSFQCILRLVLNVDMIDNSLFLCGIMWYSSWKAMQMTWRLQLNSVLNMLISVIINLMCNSRSLSGGSFTKPCNNSAHWLLDIPLVSHSLLMEVSWTRPWLKGRFGYICMFTVHHNNLYMTDGSRPGWKLHSLKLEDMCGCCLQS